jgi:hypothetical protein
MAEEQERDKVGLYIRHCNSRTQNIKIRILMEMQLLGFLVYIFTIFIYYTYNWKLSRARPFQNLT